MGHDAHPGQLRTTHRPPWGPCQCLSIKLRRAQTRKRDGSKGHVTAFPAVAAAGPSEPDTGSRHLQGHRGALGDEWGPQESDGTFIAGIIVAGFTFHRETRDESPDVMLNAERVRPYLRTCGFSEAQE